MALILFSAAVTHFWKETLAKSIGIIDLPVSVCGKLFHLDTFPSEDDHRLLCLFKAFITDLVVFNV